jgi:dTDP-4-amino-4,6-dideoxygalactose transaminase
MATTRVPFNRPDFGQDELEKVKSAIAAGVTSGNGPYSKVAEEILSAMHGGKPVLLTPSCSSALELAARLIVFEPGDEVIVPSYTFVTTVSAFVSNGATPVFCDIDPGTLGLDLEQARSLISPRTKAICLVHYAGVPANPEGFAMLAQEFGLVLVEDNAHGLGGRSGEKALGTFGAMSTLSFHETKNISCGEGGALVINDETFTERAEILREKGTDRSKFLKGQIDKYTWVDIGSSWVVSDLLAAILVAQLERFDSIQKRRLSLWDRYHSSLEQWAKEQAVGLAGPGTAHTAHMFYMLFDGENRRDDFIAQLRRGGVMAVFHYQPLHSSKVGRKWVKPGQLFPVTDSVAKALVRLPLYSGLSVELQDLVIGQTLLYSLARG